MVPVGRAVFWLLPDHGIILEEVDMYTKSETLDVFIVELLMVGYIDDRSKLR